MEFLKFLIKSLFIIGLVVLMAAPLIAGYFSFKRDKKKGISYKRLRVMIFALVYGIVITLVMYLLKEFLLWLQTLSFVQWLAAKVSISGRTAYFVKVFVAILVNFGIGLLFRLLLKLVRIGLKKKELVKPKNKDGTYNWRQKAERRAIRFFHTETWFYVARILKWFNLFLSAFYAVIFAVYQIPALFSAQWIPYDTISMIFSAGYIYPVITLIVLWEAFYFLEGIRMLDQECPELLFDDDGQKKEKPADLDAVDDEGRKCFKDFFACAVERDKNAEEPAVSADHHEITRYIGQAIENDQRNPQAAKEVYLNGMDQILRSQNSILINGSFFSEFSMYFLRYLSIILARGDNLVLVCNSDAQIDQVYQYVREGLSELSSLYCKGFRKDAVDFDDPIWRIVKISGERDSLDEAMIDDNSILITTLNYLCSADFENGHKKFIHLLDTIVFVDTLATVNGYSQQMSMLNTRMGHIAKTNAMLAKNGSVNEGFRVRYMSRQVRYICFDSTRTPGLDKVLKNMLSVDFDSVDAMHYSGETRISCYLYEGRPDDTGRRACPQFFHSKEEVGVVMNMAVLCLAKGAGNVTVFADDTIPYSNIAETIAANMGQISIAADGSNIRLNQCAYNPDDYSVIIAVDSHDNLPATLRRYASMTSDKPALLIVFSRPYLFRDYYLDNIETLWTSAQMTRIPVEEGTKKDIAQKILVKANAGGITEEEILRLCVGIPQLEPLVKQRNTNGILRALLEVYGIPQEDRIDLYRYFEYSTVRDFDENGVYTYQDKVMLRRQGRLYDIISGRDMVMMVLGDREVPLPVPKSRLTQNYITDQNLLYNGNIYHIHRIDALAGKVYARLAVSGINDEAYQYLQVRNYRVDCGADKVSFIVPTKHVVLNRRAGDVAVDDVFVSVFRAPTEVLTSGYYELDPHKMAVDHVSPKYHSIDDSGSDRYARQTYRKYGAVESPVYSSEDVDFISKDKGALMMSVKLSGQFGGDINKTMALAAVMLNEILHTMFPSAADSVAVCPVLHGELAGEDAKKILAMQPELTVIGQNDVLSQSDFELVIIEDSDVDLGVISVLMSAGDDLLKTLFAPIHTYLKWYADSKQKRDYLYFGLGHEPACFDFASLQTLSTMLGDDKHDLKFVEMDTLVEYEVCDFCGKRYAKGSGMIELDDGRCMCRECAGNLVGNNKKILKAHLDRAKIFLESTYGITLDDDYEFCFESTVKIANTLKHNRDLMKRGSDIPLKGYVDDKKKVHVEYSIPSVSLSELLVRELTYVWQIRHLPDLQEDLAEGHIALVALQYLRFLNQNSLAAIRSNYYERTGNPSGEGYRKLVRALLANPQYENNPFRYLLEQSGQGTQEIIIQPVPRLIETGDFGKPYTPEAPDRSLDGTVTYFYYSRLTATMRQAYDVILSGIQSHSEKVLVNGCTFDDVCKVVDAIRYDRPELFYFTMFSVRGNEVFLFYGASAEEVELLNSRMAQIVPQYLEGIDDSMSAYDVAIRLHIKVIKSVDYDTVGLNKQKAEGGPANDQIDYLRTICGVFLNGKAVCEGYARAMQYLLQKCGVECGECVGDILGTKKGENAAHAWNILRIDGDYYYLDTTWDDRSNTIQSVKKTDFGLGYFCITSDELSRTRDLKYCPTEMPNCAATRGNYYTHNDLVISQYDLEKIKRIAQQAAESNETAFTFKCASKRLYEDTLQRLCADGQDCYDVLKAAAKKNKQILTNMYSYSYDENIWTITILFKFK